MNGKGSVQNPELREKMKKPPKMQEALCREPLGMRFAEWLFGWVAENAKTGCGLIRMGCVVSFLAFFFMYVTAFMLGLFMSMAIFAVHGIPDPHYRDPAPVTASVESDKPDEDER